MKISIVTPCWNSQETILRTLESIHGQSYAPIEWIIVDNLSSDNTLNIVKENFSPSMGREIKIVSEKDDGISDAFNKGIKAATGTIIAILNSDDAYSSVDVLKNVAQVFNDDGEISFVHGDMLFVDENFGSNRRGPLMCSVDYAMPYNHPTMFLKKSLYDKIGLFKVDYRLAMDFELVLRMYSKVDQCTEKGFYIEDCLVDMYAGGVSDTLELKSIGEVEKALKEHNFWSRDAIKYQKMRRFRIYFKKILTKIGLKKVISFWRNYKWE